MLLVLLKSVKSWAYKILFDNKIADNEPMFFIKEEIDERNEE